MNNESTVPGSESITAVQAKTIIDSLADINKTLKSIQTDMKKYDDNDGERLENAVETLSETPESVENEQTNETDDINAQILEVLKDGSVTANVELNEEQQHYIDSFQVTARALSGDFVVSLISIAIGVFIIIGLILNKIFFKRF